VLGTVKDVTLCNLEVAGLDQFLFNDVLDAFDTGDLVGRILLFKFGYDIICHAAGLGDIDLKGRMRLLGRLSRLADGQRYPQGVKVSNIAGTFLDLGNEHRGLVFVGLKCCYQSLG